MVVVMMMRTGDTVPQRIRTSKRPPLRRKTHANSQGTKELREHTGLGPLAVIEVPAARLRVPAHAHTKKEGWRE